MYDDDHDGTGRIFVGFSKSSSRQALIVQSGNRTPGSRCYLSVTCASPEIEIP